MLRVSQGVFVPLIRRLIRDYRALPELLREQVEHRPPRSRVGVRIVGEHGIGTVDRGIRETVPPKQYPIAATLLGSVNSLAIDTSRPARPSTRVCSGSSMSALQRGAI
jgi:hypothetical protein